MQTEDIAKIVMDMQKSHSETIGDFRKPMWKGASWARKMSYMDQVEFVLATPNCVPERLHEFWAYMKIQTGWTLGPKNRTKKIHPYLVPYLELPEEVKNKYKMFLAIVEILK